MTDHPYTGGGGGLTEFDLEAIRAEAERHSDSTDTKVPKAVYQIDGCDCGGIDIHRNDCTIHELDDRDVQARIHTAWSRLRAYDDELHRLRREQP